MRTTYIGGGTGGGGGAVTSVFGRTGAVVAANDYNSTQVINSSGVAGATVTAALNTLASSISALVTGVSSVFGRAGAVVAANGDYNSTQVTNSSGVAGATVTAALNTLAAAVVVAGTLVSNVAQGQAPQTNGVIGQALTSTATGSQWGTDFGANTLVTTANISLGTNPAGTGRIRLAHASSIRGRNSANSADVILFDWGVNTADTLIVSGTTLTLNSISGNFTAQVAGSAKFSATTTDTFLDNTTTITQRIGGTTKWVQGANDAIGFMRGIGWDQSVATPRLYQQDSAGATGQLLEVQAQNAVTTGGDVLVHSGTGATVAGKVRLGVGGTDFLSIQLAAADFFAIGPAASATGFIRTTAAFTLNRRNAANSADRNLIQCNAGDDTVVFGDITGSSGNIQFTSTTGALRTGSTTRVSYTGTTFALGSGIATLNLNSGANTAIQINSTNAIGFNKGTGTVRNMTMWGDGSENYQSGDKITLWLDRTAAPTANPAGGFFCWSETGGLFATRSVAGNILIMTNTSAATATAGGGAITPATVSEFLTVNFNGNVRKIALYAN